MDKVAAAIYKTLGYVPSPSQLEFHESNARFKFIGAGSRFGKSLCGAMDVIPEILKPNTRGWIVGPCVDESTEILSIRGWLRYDQLKAGDIVLTLNGEGLAEWQPCKKINVLLCEGDMIRIKQRGHDSLTTINHRWLVGHTGFDIATNGRRLNGYRFVTTETYSKPNEFVLASAPVIDLPKQRKYEDSFVELVAWYWTEGTKKNTLRISQNLGEGADRIRRAAQDFFGDPGTYIGGAYWKDWTPQYKQADRKHQGNFTFYPKAARLLREAAPEGVLTAKFISSLTKEQLDLLIDISVMADGHQRFRVKESGRVHRERVVVQKDENRLKAFQMAVQLAGYQSVVHKEECREGCPFVINIFERNKLWLGQKKQLLNRSIEYYKGHIWCPVTPNGTWFARRNGTVYSTGNSYDQPSKEFRYIYDALVNKLGFKTKRELNVAFTTPGPQTLLFPWGSEVFTKSEQNPDALLGEEIDWLILSEGSRLKEETFDMYLRARLGSRHGRVLVPTTPHGYNWLYKRFYLPAVNGDLQYWAKVDIKVTENPTFDQEEYDRAKRELPENAFAEQYDGCFVAWSGLIYRRFSRSVHVIDPIPIRANWPVYCAIDPHPSTPVGIMWLTVDEYGTWYVCHEMFHPELTIPEIADRLKKIEKKCPVTRYLIDPNAKLIDKLRGQTISVQMQFRRLGIPVVEANNKFDGAWYKISDMLTPKATFGDETNLKPKLFVFRDCQKTIEEFENYTWENEKTGKSHLMDTLKYIANDNPVRAMLEEEIEKIEKEEEDYLKTRDKRTGY